MRADDGTKLSLDLKAGIGRPPPGSDDPSCRRKPESSLWKYVPALILGYSTISKWCDCCLIQDGIGYGAAGKNRKIGQIPN
jgi:hypothetical protein